MKLELREVTKQYGKYYASDHITAVLTEGIYGLLGPNGAGKTTLIRILAGLLAADSGKILIDGLVNLTAGYYDRIGYMPQYPGFYGNFSVKEMLSYFCCLKGVGNKTERIREVLELVHLEQESRKRISSLSGGMKQRLGIAQAILNNPKLLILDEPTAGLDPGERIRFRNLITRLAEGRIVLLATHIVSDVENIAKEILLLEKGRLVGQGSTEALEQSLKGKVWETVVSADYAAAMGEKYHISRIRQTEGGYLVRIVEDGCPPGHALAAAPDMEDVFLYYFQSGRCSPAGG